MLSNYRSQLLLLFLLIPYIHVISLHLPVVPLMSQPLYLFYRSPMVGLILQAHASPHLRYFKSVKSGQTATVSTIN